MTLLRFRNNKGNRTIIRPILCLFLFPFHNFIARFIPFRVRENHKRKFNGAHLNHLNTHKPEKLTELKCKLFRKSLRAHFPFTGRSGEFLSAQNWNIIAANFTTHLHLWNYMLANKNKINKIKSEKKKRNRLSFDEKYGMVAL